MWNKRLSQLLQPSEENDSDEIEFFRCSQPDQLEKLTKLLEEDRSIRVIDNIIAQLRDVVKLEHPSEKLTEEEYQKNIEAKLGDQPVAYGVWVYYPWKKTLVHLLDEEEFIRVRTVRNAYKITPAEQQMLREKKVGVVGLSVGQSAVMAIVQERLCGEIRIADFDTLELSNLNRIRTSALNLGLKKACIVKREIAEMDPYMKVVVYDDGIHAGNANAFLTSGGKLDLLVEECDSADVKILLRKLCKKEGIAVVMETSDRGLLDIERFDLDPAYPILHGNISEGFLEKETFNAEEKMALLYQCFDVTKASPRMIESLREVGKTITTWPQLATDVLLGGAVVATTARLIFLTKTIKSARIYVDVPSIIGQ